MGRLSFFRDYTPKVWSHKKVEFLKRMTKYKVKFTTPLKIAAEMPFGQTNILGPASKLFFHREHERDCLAKFIQ